MGAHDTYLSHIDQPYGKLYAETVGRFQEGFLADCVARDIDKAFEMAVEVATRLLPVIKSKAAL